MARTSDNHKGFELACEYRHETENALLIYDHESEDEHWLPLSAVQEIHGHKVRGQAITVVIDEWLARKRGFYK